MTTGSKYLTANAAVFHDTKRRDVFVGASLLSSEVFCFKAEVGAVALPPLPLGTSDGCFFFKSGVFTDKDTGLLRDRGVAGAAADSVHLCITAVGLREEDAGVESSGVLRCSVVLELRAVPVQLVNEPPSDACLGLLTERKPPGLARELVGVCCCRFASADCLSQRCSTTKNTFQSVTGKQSETAIAVAAYAGMQCH